MYILQKYLMIGYPKVMIFADLLKNLMYTECLFLIRFITRKLCYKGECFRLFTRYIIF